MSLKLGSELRCRLLRRNLNRLKELRSSWLLSWRDTKRENLHHPKVPLFKKISQKSRHWGSSEARTDWDIFKYFEWDMLNDTFFRSFEWDILNEIFWVRHFIETFWMRHFVKWNISLRQVQVQGLAISAKIVFAFNVLVLQIQKVL